MEDFLYLVHSIMLLPSTVTLFGGDSVQRRCWYDREDIRLIDASYDVLLF